MIIGLCLYCKKEFRKRENKYKFCSLRCSSNYNKNGLRNVTLPQKSPQLAEFVGICLGDGYVSKYQTCITLNTHADKEYIVYVQNLIRWLFPQVTITIIVRKDNATDIRINSSVIAVFLQALGIIPRRKSIPGWIYESEAFRRSCVKGLVDTEGSISFKTYKSKRSLSVYKQLNFRNTDIRFMKFVRDTLIDSGLHPTMTLKSSLYISNNKDILRYKQLIGFGNPKLNIKVL